jgi:hypothetical protein
MMMASIANWNLDQSQGDQNLAPPPPLLVTRTIFDALELVFDSTKRY